MATPEDDLDRLRALGPPDTAWEAPPDALWARIAQAIDEDERPEQAPAVVHLARRERRLGWVLAAAAAVVALVAAAAFVIARSSAGDGTVIARSPLDPLADSGTGVVELLDEDGTLRLRVDVAGLDPIEGYYELWLLNEDVSGLISLGPLRADGSYQLPAGIDPAAFPIVDVSIESFDGDPSHSSESVLRGRLDDAG